MVSGRHIGRCTAFRVLVGVACAALLVAGCGARERRSSAAAPIDPQLQTECARIKPRLRTDSAPKPAERELAPAGASEVRLCQFSGTHAVPPRPLKLRHSHDVRERRVLDHIVRELNRLAPMPAAVSCPNDDSSAIVLLLPYRQHGTLTVEVGLSGCNVVTNGSVYRTAARGRGPRLIRELKRLARQR